MKGQARGYYNTPVQSLNMDLKPVAWTVWIRSMEKYDSIFYFYSGFPGNQGHENKDNSIVLFTVLFNSFVLPEQIRPSTPSFPLKLKEIRVVCERLANYYICDIKFKKTMAYII